MWTTKSKWVVKQFPNLDNKIQIGKNAFVFNTAQDND
jgi:hypothetical protein